MEQWSIFKSVPKLEFKMKTNFESMEEGMECSENVRRTDLS